MSSEANITFVGNEGVLLESGGNAVLVDALFGDGAAAYTSAPRAVIDAVETARTPFDAVDVVLATHFHPDHFDPDSVARYLAHNARARVLTTPQARRLLESRAAGFDGFAARVGTVLPGEGQCLTTTIGDVVVDAFGLSHGKVNYGDVEHVGFVVTMGGATFLHLGDGIIAEKTLRAAGVLDRELDAAILPFWFLTYPSGRRLLEHGFARRPRRLFAVHIPPEHQRRLVDEVRAFDRRATPLVEPMTRVRIGVELV